MSPRHSIVLPVRNGAAYLGLAVESALAQSQRDLEVVVLDNASDDGSADILARLAAGDARLRVFRSDQFLSMEDNWERVHRLCADGTIRGEFVTLSGHDDRYEPDFLAVIDRLIGEAPQAALYQTHFRIIDGAGRVSALSRPIPARERQLDFFLARAFEIRDTFGTGYVFRRAHYVQVGGIPRYPRLMFADDMLWLRLLALGDKATAPEVCFEYRRHESNTSSQLSTARFKSTLDALALFLRDVDREFPALTRGEMQRAALRHLIAPILTHVEKGAYRVGFAPAVLQPEWDALAARLQELEGAARPRPLRYRPAKRVLHALRRWREALRR